MSEVVAITVEVDLLPPTEIVAVVDDPVVVEVSIEPPVELVTIAQQGPAGAPGADGILATVTVTLSQSMPTLACVRVLGSIAYPVTSMDVDEPDCDGILLESGGVGEDRAIAVVDGYTFSSPLAVPGSDGGFLYLGQSGSLTSVVPSLISGDNWYYPLARRMSDHAFRLTPGFPVHL